MKSGETENYIWQRAIVNTSRNGKPLGQLEPEHRFYKASRQPTHVVSVRHRLNEDLYLNLAATEEKTATLQAYIFPLVSWIWMGAVVLVFGTLVALVPSKVKMQYARTEVVGITAKNVPVEK